MCSDVLTGQEAIDVQLASKELMGQNVYHGKCRMDLANLKDQLMHDLWLDLKSADKKAFPGRLHVRVQWIHSKITYYADLIGRTKEKIREQSASREDMELFLDKLKST